MRKIASLFTMLMLFAALAFGQNRTITGTVTDDKGDALPGASVSIKGTRTGVSADNSGQFRILAKTGDILIVSGSGFDAAQVTVGAGATVSVSLKRAIITGEEVIVTTATGIKRQKKELGYSTTQVTGKDLTAGKATNLASALSGKAAGLLVIQPNSGVTNDVRITLRGSRSISGNNQPILVIDGTIVSLTYLNQINPNDVGTVDILKGAAATALYGNEAFNGAIIITTKKGGKNKPIINYSTTVNWESVSLMPKLQNEFGSYGGEGLDAQGRSSYIPYENQSYGPRYDGSIVPLGNPVRIFNPDGTFKDVTYNVPYAALKNERRKFFDIAPTIQNDVSFSAGDATSQIFMSVEDVYRKGTVPGDKSKRNSIRLNASKDFGKASVSTNLNYIKSGFDVVGGDVFQGRSVYWSVLNTAAHVPLRKLSNTATDPFADPSGYFNAYYANPWWAINNSRNVDDRDNIIGNVKFELKPLSWLTTSYQVDYNAFFDNFVYHRNATHYTASSRDYANNGFGIYPASGGTRSSNFPGIAQEGYRENTNYARIQGTFLATVRKNFKNFTNTLLLGQTVYQIKRNVRDVGYDASTGAINTYDDVSTWGPQFAIGTPLSYSEERKQRSVGVFADLTIGYKNFLFLHGSVRTDKDSRLEAANRTFTYPAGDISFIFTDAIQAFRNQKVLTSGKIRVSYAKVGQINVAPYSTRDVYVTPTGAGFPYSNADGSISSYSIGGTINNPNIKPEFSSEKEVGLELAWFKGRVVTDFAYYTQKSTNQTLQLSISAAAGRTSAILNIGEVNVKGFESDVKVSILRHKKLQWNVGGNYSYVNNKVISIDPKTTSQQLAAGGFGGGGVYAIVGSPYPFLQTTDWIRDGSGRIIVDASSGLPTRDPNVKGYGTTQPPHRVGINTSLIVGRFVLSALAEARFGAVVFNAIGSDLDFTGVSVNSTKFNRVKFVIPNSSYLDPVSGKYVDNTSVVTNTDAWNFFGNLYNSVGSNYVTSADFWKLREVSLGFDVPQTVFGKWKFIKAMNISLVGRDLLILHAKANEWTDPEFSNTTGNGTGITTNGQTPSTRKYGFSINLTF